MQDNQHGTKWSHRLQDKEPGESPRMVLYSMIGTVAGAMIVVGSLCFAGAFMVAGAATLKKVCIWAGIL